MGYDIIGDIHGHADALAALLSDLGYRERAGAWRHPRRQALFVGDFIDRGPGQVATLNIARSMVDAGSARAVMGNHELNAIAWFLPDENNPGEYLRPRHSPKYGQKNRQRSISCVRRTSGWTRSASIKPNSARRMRPDLRRRYRSGFNPSPVKRHSGAGSTSSAVMRSP